MSLVQQSTVLAAAIGAALGNTLVSASEDIPPRYQIKRLVNYDPYSLEAKPLETYKLNDLGNATASHQLQESIAGWKTGVMWVDGSPVDIAPDNHFEVDNFTVFALNNNGVMLYRLGFPGVFGGPEEGIRRWHDGVSQHIELDELLDLPPGAFSHPVARALNNRNEYAGYTYHDGPNGFGHAQLTHWDANGHLIATYPNLSDGSSTSPGDAFEKDMNDAGVIVGVARRNLSTSAEPAAVRNGVLKSLTEDHGRKTGAALAVNESGQIVGYLTNDGPYYWDENDVSTPLPKAPGAGIRSNARALDLNDEQLIVGYEYWPDLEGTRATLWHDFKIYALQNLIVTGDPEWDRLDTATSINKHGQILAQGTHEYTHPDGTTCTCRAVFILTPMCAAEMDFDNSLDFDDIELFVEAYLAEDRLADLTADGRWQTDDLEAFVYAFLAGCP